MVSKWEAYGWFVAMAVLAALAVPWFLWGDSRVALGLPVWLWWHIGWMALASVVFWLFTKRAWGVGITTPDPGRGENP
jgi:hypothetical protein